MSENDGVVTRRDFLRGTAYGAAGLAVGIGLPGAACSERDTAERDTAERGDADTARPVTTRAVLVRDADALDADGKPNGPVLERMLDDAVCALRGGDDPSTCWRELLAPEDVLGIKTNVWQPIGTPSELEAAIRQRALAAGIVETNISVRDRGLLDDPIFTSATALINIRPLRTHHWAGIGGCLKNYITFVREPWKWHDDSCADLGGLWKLPVCRGKTRLNVLLLLTPLFYGIGPHHFDPQHVWDYRGMLVGTDPVALDALGVRLLEAKRQSFFERPPRGGTSVKHVRLADERHGVGVADPERIELVRIGPMEDALI